MRPTAENDYSHETDLHPSPVVRYAFMAAGTVCVGLGVLGVFLPLLPTTPFMLLAAACYARASTRFYNWLLNNKTFGPLILEWRRHRSIPYRTKWYAIALMSITLALSIAFAVSNLYAQIALALFGVAMAIGMARIPSRDHPRRGSHRGT